MPIELSPEEHQALTLAEEPIREAREALTKLARAGVDVTKELADLERAERVRAGLLRELGSPPAARGRAPKG